jgi:hypothetical protein
LQRCDKIFFADYERGTAVRQIAMSLLLGFPLLVQAAPLAL